MPFALEFNPNDPWLVKAPWSDLHPNDVVPEFSGWILPPCLEPRSQ